MLATAARGTAILASRSPVIIAAAIKNGNDSAWHEQFPANSLLSADQGK
jgi:hypothetical protein